MQLDKSQQKIVDSDASKICVIAGAGSGKTATLTERVRKILKDGANPYNIVCITFTNMAAQEMRDRLSDIAASKHMFIGTMHSYAYKLIAATGLPVQLLTPEKERELLLELINTYGKHITEELFTHWEEMQRLQELGYKTKSEVQSSIPKEALKELNILMDKPDMKQFYQTIDNNSNDKEVIKEALETQLASHTTKEYPQTVRSLASDRGYITFDQLLMSAKLSSNKVEYLFVDEFQDVGAFEYSFLMGLNADNIFVVGDDYQCQPAQTRVLLANGDYRNIEEIKKGDTVISYNIETASLQQDQVINIQQSECNHLIEVRSKSGHVSYYTPNHRCIIRTVSGIDTIMRADNLNISHRLITYDVATHRCKCSQITSIKYIKHPEGISVYSLEVSGNHTYVADRIVTHNSIYGFKGADFEYFKKLTTSSKFRTFKLTNNYRSNSNIVKYSNNVIANIDSVIPKKCVSKVANPLPGKIIEETGNLTIIKKYVSAIPESQYGKWFIITRSNTDLVKISRMLYAIGIPSDTFKMSKISKEDRQQLMAKNSIKILTVHTAKGLEADNVIAYGYFPSPKDEESSKAMWKEKGDEECRVMYVAATRAKRNLIVINKPIYDTD